MGKWCLWSNLLFGRICGSKKMLWLFYSQVSFGGFQWFCQVGLIVVIIEFVVYFLQPYCSLHLHLHVSANPYTSGNIASRDSAPGIIVASGGWDRMTARGKIFSENKALLHFFVSSTKYWLIICNSWLTDESLDPSCPKLIDNQYKQSS